jgi:16S rRNA (cytidine1402-2'-O)-methyltransferase
VSDDVTETGRLYIVSTPIGNLGDITLRAIEVLRSAGLILAEDTRHSRVLLDHVGVKTPVASLHEHNEAAATERALERLSSGESLALISDAGTPLLSDPGLRLVRAARDAGVPIVPVPGASALLSALVASGIDTGRFTFYGFLARSGRERAAALDDISASMHTSVLYEAPGRVAATLRDLVVHGCGDREAVVARELTKQFEEFRHGTVTSLAEYHELSPPRGEVVLLISGNTSSPTVSASELRDAVRGLRAEGKSARDIVQHLVREYGAPRNLAYRVAHEE